MVRSAGSAGRTEGDALCATLRAGGVGRTGRAQGYAPCAALYARGRGV